ncbi:MAG: hypothetical protein HY471_00685 [Candidatus Sungbacteria bacterium]|nr:hypothetical protein [Candidatus Sungbacteria bacterium]
MAKTAAVLALGAIFALIFLGFFDVIEGQEIAQFFRAYAWLLGSVIVGAFVVIVGIALDLQREMRRSRQFTPYVGFPPESGRKETVMKRIIPVLILVFTLPLLAACASGGASSSSTVFNRPPSATPPYPVVASPPEEVRKLFFGRRVALVGFSDEYLREAAYAYVSSVGGEIVSGTRNVDLRVHGKIRQQRFDFAGHGRATIGGVIVDAIRVNGRQVFAPRPTSRWRAEITVNEVLGARSEAFRLHGVGEADCFADSSRSRYCDAAKRAAAYAAFNAFVPRRGAEVREPATPSASPAPEEQKESQGGGVVIRVEK